MAEHPQERQINLMHATRPEWEKKEIAEHLREMEISVVKNGHSIYSAKHHTKGEAKESKDIKVIHFIRHGQGHHNVVADKMGGCKCPDRANCPYLSPELRDPRLTEAGIKQAKSINTEGLELDLIIVSPLTRTLETATFGLEPIWKEKKVSFIAHEDCHEQSGVHICDERRDRDVLAAEFPHCDFDLIQVKDPLASDEREERISVARRGLKFMEYVYTLPHKHICVVSHSSWLLTLFNCVLEVENTSLKNWFATAEVRSVTVERKDR